jgi:AcrR family transcriptional regulator
MSASAPPDPREAVIDVVLDILTARGYDEVRLRDVSHRSRVSSKTIYKLFETRDHMVVAALERWMAANVYLKVAMPEPEETLYDVLMRFLRALFEPWTSCRASDRRGPAHR